jgi:DNA replication and repair protein RecF
MYLRHLSLTHFRNYRSLELDFSSALTLLQGRNAQGKSNLLEAIYFLATAKPVQAGNEREVVDWGAGEEPIPYARIAAVVEEQGASGVGSRGLEGASRPLNLEILLTPREDGTGFRKQIKINGVARRSMDLVGTMRAVLFMPEDIRLVDGAPSERRRYCDIALCQIDRGYGRALSQYQKVVDQRNSLLRALREQRANGAGIPATEDQLGFWDDQLVALGSQVIAARLAFLRQLEVVAQPLLTELSSGVETLHLQYLPSFNPGNFSDSDFAHLGNESFALEIAASGAPLPDLETIVHHYRSRLRNRRMRELDAGSTLYGPHRDDFRFLVNGRDLRLYGSRGQQRSAALATKLAEVQVMRERTGSSPLLLLDDVMSELDANRRATLLRALEGVPQAIVTTTDWEDFAPDFRHAARTLHVSGGRVTEATPGATATESLIPTGESTP